MPTSQIVGSTFEEGLRAPHYINRRLLTAEDLKADQQAVLARLALLGKACGYGVVEGLVAEQVAGSSTAIKIGTGLGLNRCGSPVRLPRDVQLAIGPQGTTGITIVDAGRFQDCALTQVGPAGTTAAGAYLLTAAPISRLEGAASVKAAAGSLDPPACAAQWEVEGLQFKAIRLIGFDGEPGVTDQNRRNRLAHWCYGSSSFPAIERDPLAFAESYGGLASLSADDLTDCDLPLAVFYWTGSAIEFVDRWAVRRRPIRPGALTAASGMLSDRRVAEGQARFLQFQEQLDGLLKTATNNASITAAAFFPLLPPAGLLEARLPLDYLRAIVRQLVAGALSFIENNPADMPARLTHNLAGGPLAGSSDEQKIITSVTEFTLKNIVQSGLSVESFFGNLPLSYWLIDRDLLDELLHRSWLRNPLVVAGRPPVRIYVPEEDTIRLAATAILDTYDALVYQFGGNAANVAAVRLRVTTYLNRRIAALIGQPEAGGAAFEGRPLKVLFVRSVGEPQQLQSEAQGKG